MHRFLPFLIFFICLEGCKKDKAVVENEVEFYSLNSYQLISGKCQVAASTAILNDNPIVSNQDILAYVKDDHEYRLTTSAIQKINALPSRTAFAVTVDKKIILLGIYMPPTMSSTCDHSITMFALDNTVYMQLGFPGWIQTSSTTAIDDQRNNSLLLATLKTQGKLR